MFGIANKEIDIILSIFFFWIKGFPPESLFERKKKLNSPSQMMRIHKSKGVYRLQATHPRVVDPHVWSILSEATGFDDFRSSSFLFCQNAFLSTFFYIASLGVHDPHLLQALNTSAAIHSTSFASHCNRSFAISFAMSFTCKELQKLIQ
jgi:hypothetical protein